MASAAPPKVDRQTTTPFLLKLFYRANNFHRLDEFSPDSSLPPHLQIYTWTSCTLRELTHLLTSAMPSIFPTPAAGTRLAFRLVYPDAKSAMNDPGRLGRFLHKDLGSVVVGVDGGRDDGEGADGDSNGAPALGIVDGDSERTLQEARFIIGDFVTCTILPPLGDGSVAPPPASAGMSARMGGGGGPHPGSRGGYMSHPYENGSSFRGRGRGSYAPDFSRGAGVPPGEWRRGERPPGRGYGGGGGWESRESAWDSRESAWDSRNSGWESRDSAWESRDGGGGYGGRGRGYDGRGGGGYSGGGGGGDGYRSRDGRAGGW